jgi:tripartite-type tricarboxylate transporter receptor subunit TctC
LLAAAAPALAQTSPLAEAYKGRTATVIVSSSAGGGYDTLSRAIARHIGKHLPGNPTVVVQNMPGAGGIVATNYMYNVAPKDGLHIAGVQNNAPLEPLFGTKSATYDATKFNWVGTPSVEVGLMAVWHASGVKTIEDARNKPLTAGSSGANSAPSFYVRLLNELMGFKVKVVTGYPGQTQAFLAMERGELDFYGTTFWSALTSTKSDWIAAKKLNIVVQYGPQKAKELPDVPFLRDIIKTPDDRALLVAGEGPLTIGRPYLMPPGVPADRVAAMRKAFQDTMKDPDFVADAKRQRLDISSPRTGEELQKELETIYATPSHIVERLRRIAQQK